MENWRRIRNGNGRLELGEVKLRRIWKEYFEGLYNIDIQEYVAVSMCGFDGVQKGNYFGGEPIKRTEVEVRVRKLNNGKVAGKNEVTRDVIKSGSDMRVD